MCGGGSTTSTTVGEGVSTVTDGSISAISAHTLFITPSVHVGEYP